MMEGHISGIATGLAIGLGVAIITYLFRRAEKGFTSDITQAMLQLGYRIDSQSQKVEYLESRVRERAEYVDGQLRDLRNEFREFRGGQVRITKLPDGHREE